MTIESVRVRRSIWQSGFVARIVTDAIPLIVGFGRTKKAAVRDAARHGGLAPADALAAWVREQ